MTPNEELHSAASAGARPPQERRAFGIRKQGMESRDRYSDAARSATEASAFAPQTQAPQYGKAYRGLMGDLNNKQRHSLLDHQTRQGLADKKAAADRMGFLDNQALEQTAYNRNRDTVQDQRLAENDAYGRERDMRRDTRLESLDQYGRGRDTQADQIAAQKQHEQATQQWRQEREKIEADRIAMITKYGVDPVEANGIAKQAIERLGQAPAMAAPQMAPAGLMPSTGAPAGMPPQQAGGGLASPQMDTTFAPISPPKPAGPSYGDQTRRASEVQDFGVNLSKQANQLRQQAQAIRDNDEYNGAGIFNLADKEMLAQADQLDKQAMAIESQAQEVFAQAGGLLGYGNAAPAAPPAGSGGGLMSPPSAAPQAPAQAPVAASPTGFGVSAPAAPPPPAALPPQPPQNVTGWSNTGLIGNAMSDVGQAVAPYVPQQPAAPSPGEPLGLAAPSGPAMNGLGGANYEASKAFSEQQQPAEATPQPPNGGGLMAPQADDGSTPFGSLTKERKANIERKQKAIYDSIKVTPEAINQAMDIYKELTTGEGWSLNPLAGFSAPKVSDQDAAAIAGAYKALQSTDEGDIKDAIYALQQVYSRSKNPIQRGLNSAASMRFGGAEGAPIMTYWDMVENVLPRSDPAALEAIRAGQRPKAKDSDESIAQLGGLKGKSQSQIANAIEENKKREAAAWADAYKDMPSGSMY